MISPAMRSDFRDVPMASEEMLTCESDFAPARLVSLTNLSYRLSVQNSQSKYTIP